MVQAEKFGEKFGLTVGGCSTHADTHRMASMRPRDNNSRDSMIGGATDAGQGFVYSGQIEKGQMHGKGTLVYPNGKLLAYRDWKSLRCISSTS